MRSLRDHLALAMASGRRKKSKEEPAVKQEVKKEDKPVKRRRSADGDRQFRDDKRQRVSRGPVLSASACI